MLESPSSGSNEKPKPAIDVRFEKRVDAVMAEAAELPSDLSEPNHSANSLSGQVESSEANNEIKFLDPRKVVLEPHPDVHDLFPVTDRDIVTMMESIKRDGQFDPITVLRMADGARVIGDGVTRYQASGKLGVRLKYEEKSESDLGGKSVAKWAIARNIASKTGRQMNDSQRALVAAKMVRNVYGPECKENSKTGKPVEHGGTANEQAAHAVGVSVSRIRYALNIFDIPLLVDAVWNGKLAISRAAEIAKLDPDEIESALKLAIAERSGALEKPATKTKTNSAKSAPIASEAPVDALGREIPASLLDVFTEKKHFTRLQNSLRRIEKSLVELKKVDAGRLLQEPIAESVTALRKNIEGAEPYCVCPDSDTHTTDEVCGTCSGFGWLSKSEWNELDENKTS